VDEIHGALEAKKIIAAAINSYVENYCK
jgi:hypothetical protein